MLRILYTIEERGTKVFGGAARDLVLILKHLDRKRFEPAILLTGDDSFLRFLEQEKVVDIEIYRLPLPPWRKFKYRVFAPFVIRRLEKIIRDGRFDIVHVNSGYNDLPYVVRAARRAGAVSAFTIRHGDIIGRKVNDYDYQKADLVIACAEEHRRLLEPWGVEAVTIYSGVEESLSFEPIKKAFVGIPEGAKIVGTVANLMSFKGYPDLLQAIAKLLPRFPDLWLVAVGGGDEAYRNELLSLARRLSIADRVVFAGFQPCGRQWIPLFDLFVLASVRGEAATLAVLEAMAEEKAVVATSVGGISELVVDGITGLLVPPGEPTRLAAAIADLIDHPEMRASMGRAGRERVVRHFTLRAEVESLQDRYLQLVKEKDHEK